MSKPDCVIHTPQEIVSIRAAGAAAGYVRDQLAGLIRPGISTKDIDDLAGRLIFQTGGKSAFLGYRGYPGQICISVNDEVVHGIGRPDRIIQPEDIVSIDIGVDLNGGIGDTAVTLAMQPEIPPRTRELLEFTELALKAGIEKARSGNYVKDISAAIQRVADKAKLGIVREYVGHGCGTKLHEPPEVPNFVCIYRGPKLVPGMVLAIEPMLNLGTHKVFTEPDQWTVRTRDGKLSAHFEHMVLITEREPEILTCQKM
ncbi:MAG: type I methionyl aminopeptidase [Victivallaceae bacterium]|jgi:methionyl aminopeptidase